MAVHAIRPDCRGVFRRRQYRSQFVQFLFAEDILGNNPPPYPRHSKQYRQIHEMLAAVQKERVAGFTEFIDDVRQGTFPAAEHVIKAPDGLIEDFLDGLD